MKINLTLKLINHYLMSLTHFNIINFQGNAKLLFSLIYIFGFSTFSYSQENVIPEKNAFTGVSVAPAHFHFTQKQGEQKTYDITIKNKTGNKKEFKINVFDFNMNESGKSTFLPSGKGKYSLSKWLMVSPTFVELNPLETRKVRVTLSVPQTNEGKKAAWSIIMVEQETPRTSLLDNAKGDNTVALGVIPTFAFGIFAYQNPPNVINNKIDFIDFDFSSENNKNSIYIKTKNSGDGISYCTSYIDLTNLSTGEQTRLKVKKFTILPDFIRTFKFDLPQGIAKGKYLAVGVLDYEQAEEIQAAQLEFEIQ